MEKTLESEVRLLLDEQCAEPGFCLPAGERGILQGNPPRAEPVKLNDTSGCLRGLW